MRLLLTVSNGGFMTYPTNITDNNNNNNININNNNDVDAINYNKNATTSSNGSFGEKLANCDSMYTTTSSMSSQMQSSFLSSCAFTDSVEMSTRSAFDNVSMISSMNHSNQHDLETFNLINSNESLELFNSVNQRSLQIGVQNISPKTFEHTVTDYSESKTSF